MSDYMYVSESGPVLIEEMVLAKSSSIIDQMTSIRKRQNKTQQDIADATGIKRANISRIESKHYTPTLDVLSRYASALGYEINLSLVPRETSDSDK